MISIAGMSCVGNNDADVTGINFTQVDPLASYSKSGGNFKLSLTDAPNKELAEVVVNIDSILLKANSKELIVSKDIGPVDLLTLQNGKMMGISELTLDVGTKVSQARLILKEEGNYIRYKDGSVCQLQTPSQQNTGLKILSPEFEIEEGRSYSMVIDFDAKKSIVHQGNGGCLLKPVLKWGGITSIKDEDVEEIVEDENAEVEQEVIADHGSGETNTDPVVEDDSSNSGDQGTVVDNSNNGSTSNDSSNEVVVDDSSNNNDSTSNDSNTSTDVVPDDSTSNDVVADDSSNDDVANNDIPVDEVKVIDCQNLGFDAFDPATYPADFVASDYEHCF